MSRSLLPGVVVRMIDRDPAIKALPTQHAGVLGEIQVAGVQVLERPPRRLRSTCPIVRLHLLRHPSQAFCALVRRLADQRRLQCYPQVGPIYELYQAKRVGAGVS
ncbi:MAG: hypothetical protein O7G87_03765 [bacterium]|nr:hypothetical protein [bacterium]